MERPVKTILIALMALVAVAGFLTSEAATKDTNINLNVECNTNGACETDLGENPFNCAADCLICNNNNICEPSWGETRANCAADCQVCDKNGNCETDLGENEDNCADDCPPVCNNNGACETSRGENESNCAADCPYIPEPEAAAPAGESPAQKLKLAEITDLAINDIKLTSARISWNTDISAICRTNFGLDPEYRNGTVFETNFARIHAANITGLVPETVYHINIVCANANNKDSESGDREFSTLALPDSEAPANINNFQAIAGDGLVDLKWDNPQEKDFNGVRILRSDKFYPADPWAGEIVYEGRGNSVKDRDLQNGKTYYYTAFTYDGSGNYSSGAIASAVPGQPGKTAEIPDVPAPPEIQKLDLSHFDFFQNGKRIDLVAGRLAVDRFQPLVVSIPYSRVPEVLKTIMVTLKHEDKIFSFLLRVNKDKTAYAATLVPPDAGVYPFDISILDYKNRAYKKISGELNIVKAELAQPIRVIEYMTVKKIPPIIWILLAILALIAFRQIYRLIEKKRQRRSSKTKAQSSN